MPIKKNTLSEVGPSAGQMKRSFSSVERTQINAMSGLSGSLSSKAGGINGDVSNAFSSYTNSTNGRLGVAASIAASLEASGVTTGVSRAFLSNTVSKSMQQKKGLHKSIATTPTDLSNPGNRMPSLARRSPTSLIDKKRQVVSGSPNNSFPNGVENSPAYVELHFKAYNRPDPMSPGSISDLTNIKLPLPENFSQQFSIQYQPRDQGFLGDGIAGQVSGASLKNTLTNMKEGDIGLADAKAFGGGVLKTVGSASFRAGMTMLDTINDVTPVKDVAGAVMGMIPNPHKTIFFQGMDLRTFQWTWKLIPRNKGEAESIAAIIKKFKENAIPKTQGIALKYPSLMQPKLKGKLAETFGEFRLAMISGLSINFAAEGTSAFFRDGRPVSVVLSIEFQEVDIVTSGEVSGE